MEKWLYFVDFGKQHVVSYQEEVTAAPPIFHILFVPLFTHDNHSKLL